MEGREAHPPRAVPTIAKEKGKAAASPALPSPVEKVASPISLKALITNSSLFEELLLKDPKEKIISWLGSVYRKEVMKKV